MTDTQGFELNVLDIKCVHLNFSLQEIQNDNDYGAELRIRSLRRFAVLANMLADQLIDEVHTPVSGVHE